MIATASRTHFSTLLIGSSAPGVKFCDGNVMRSVDYQRWQCSVVQHMASEAAEDRLSQPVVAVAPQNQEFRTHLASGAGDRPSNIPPGRTQNVQLCIEVVPKQLSLQCGGGIASLLG